MWRTSSAAVVGLVLACTVSGAASVACSGPGDTGDTGDTGEAGERGRARPNLLVITIDTLRADFLEPYGEELPTSPALDAFAHRSVVFEAAQATSSWTLPSLSSLHTSLDAMAHGCIDFGSRLGSESITLAQHLLQHGFHTGAVASHTFLARHYGLSRGFVDYDDELVQDVARSHAAITSEAVSDKGIAWLEQQALLEGAGPWFLWLHYFDPHATYQTHEGISEAFGERPDQLYRGEIAYTDRHVGRVFDALDRFDLAKDTVVLVTADHGEEFGDHGLLAHGQTLHREVLRVPFLLRAPGVPPARVEDPVSLIDVAPTVLELVGAPPLPLAQGRSLVPFLRGETLPGRAVLARLERRASQAFDAIVVGRWKLIRDRTAGSARLFDRVEDPDETVDLAGDHPERVQALERELDERLRLSEELKSQLGGSDEVGIGEAEQEALRKLGYAGDE